MADTYTLNSVDAAHDAVNITVTLTGIGTKTLTLSGVPLTSITDLTDYINTMVAAYKAGIASQQAPTVDPTITAAVGSTINLSA